MDVLKYNQDVQLADGRSVLRAYVAKCVSKFSDAMRSECFNDDVRGGTIAMNVRSRYKPLEPEMMLQLFGMNCRQWGISTLSRGARRFRAPAPDDEKMPPAITQYENCVWKGPK